MISDALLDLCLSNCGLAVLSAILPWLSLTARSSGIVKSLVVMCAGQSGDRQTSFFTVQDLEIFEHGVANKRLKKELAGKMEVYINKDVGS